MGYHKINTVFNRDRDNELYMWATEDGSHDCTEALQFMLDNPHVLIPTGEPYKWIVAPLDDCVMGVSDG